jgi:molybdate transport system ATP-binding protein
MLTILGTTSHPRFTLDVDCIVGNETVAVVGDNGTGKSTLLHLVAGLHRLDRGVVTLATETLDDPSNRVFVEPQRRRMAMLFQQPLLFPFLDACDNVAFGLRRSGTPADAARTQALEALARLNAEHLAKRRVASLSGGEAQRVALARALVLSPRALLLDEPFAALDRRSRHDMRAALRDTFQALNVPRLIVTHDDADVETLCTREIRLERTTGFEPATLTLAR